MSAVTGRRILVGMSGGIAAYKVCDLVSRLGQDGAAVRVVMTANAQRFVSPLTLATLSGNPVEHDMWAERDDISHIALADFAEVAVVAPATANIIGKFARGIADDLLSTVLLALDCPILIAPAMNTRMLNNAAVQENLAILRKRGVIIIAPEEGHLACGDSGAGRLPNTDVLVAELERALGADGPLAGRHVAITAGPTREALDPVRFLSNPSSGRMGYALADAARRRGAKVTLVSGPTSLEPPAGVELVRVTTAEEMAAAVEELRGKIDVFIGAAAVADWRPVEVAAQKMKKGEEQRRELVLERTPDIIASVAGWEPKPVIVGFAAETEKLMDNAREKLERKGWDLAVANEVGASDTGFAASTNRAAILDAAGGLEEPALMSKDELADEVLHRVEEILAGR
ncbi:MAG: bifunctional phosphopantothenoylcysteine decarboxylase/phosphopantothenate--cysteine ligase CoaBC [Armatimonadetes bacterium]|nr:bifunctional phosphopantothenoylcysteine decarboxylase/phosphopantothenate--cysteine ligase CoaBC [Armatimonadota bacterium]